MTRPRSIESDRKNMHFCKVVLLAFMTMVVNCTAGMEHNKDRCCGGSCRELIGL